MFIKNELTIKTGWPFVLGFILWCKYIIQCWWTTWKFDIFNTWFLESQCGLENKIISRETYFFILLLIFFGILGSKSWFKIEPWIEYYWTETFLLVFLPNSEVILNELTGIFSCLGKILFSLNDHIF